MRKNTLEFNRRTIPLFKEPLVDIDNESLETVIGGVLNKEVNESTKNIILNMVSIHIFMKHFVIYAKIIDSNGDNIIIEIEKT